MRMTKVTVVSGFAVLAIAGAGVGVAAAESGHSQSSAPAASSDQTASGDAVTLTSLSSAAASATDSGDVSTAASGAEAATKPKAKALRRWLLRVEHGELTLRDGMTVDVQRGTVETVSSTSITVKCQDGYIGSYTVTGSTKVRKDKASSSVSQVATGDRVLVIAQKTSTADTALRVFDPARAGGKRADTGSTTTTD